MGEGKNVQAILMVLVLLYASAAGQAPTQAPRRVPPAKPSFGTCFFGCAVMKCLVAPQKLLCVGKCFAECLFSPHPLGLDDCRHNCAADQCSRLITDDFKLEDVEKVIECVDGCDESANQCGALGPVGSMAVVNSPNKT